MWKDFHDASNGTSLYEAIYTRIGASDAVRRSRNQFLVVHDESGATPRMLAKIITFHKAWDAKW